MSTAALPQNTLLPQAPGGNAPGAALALVVHAGLVVALTLGVDWRNRVPDTVSAELWAAVPQMAAPPPAAEVAPASPPSPPSPPPPPPTPVPRAEVAPPVPDIAIVQERRRKAEAERKRVDQETEVERKKREKSEKLAAQKEAERLAQDRANDERLTQQHKDNVRRLMGQAGATPGQTATAGNATQTAAPSATYAGKVKARVRPNIVFTGTLAGSSVGDSAAEVEVNAAAGGSIISRRLIKSSGNKDWDETVLRAIDKTRDLPPDTDGRVPARLIIAFRPNE